MSDSFEKQSQALENQFFAKVNQQLLEKLRQQNEVQEQVSALRSITHIEDETLLKAMVERGLTAERATALKIVPMVLVAWADGSVDAAERHQLLECANRCNIDSNSPSGQLLEHWLKNQPPEGLLQTWCDYAKSLVGSMQHEDAQKLKTNIMNQLRDCATISGGILGWGAVTAGESKIMQAVEAALTR
jgi:hypothetical protein